MSRLSLSLSENAISFAEEALSNAVAAEENPARWKFAIFSLAQAVELSLKDLLSRQHPFLIYKNVDKPTRTVGIDQVASRLRHIANLELTPDESSALKTAVDVRNKIVHHHVDASIADLKLVFARLIGFLNDFHRKHLDDSLQDLVPDDLWQAGVKIREYGEEIFRRALEQMKADDIGDECLMTCPKCGWDALCAYEPKQDKCYVCGHIETVIVCERCQKLMLEGEHEEHGKKNYCWDCLCYITDDYWYEQSVGK